MTDRELLELAAKAAGIEYQLTDDGEVIEYFGGGLQIPFDGGKWNPLTDDGDALRLAVALNFAVSVAPIEGNVTAFDDTGVQVWERLEDDPYAATRRAIVRAAAQIGEKLK